MEKEKENIQSEETLNTMKKLSDISSDTPSTDDANCEEQKEENLTVSSSDSENTIDENAFSEEDNSSLEDEDMDEDSLNCGETTSLGDSSAIDSENAEVDPTLDDFLFESLGVDPEGEGEPKKEPHFHKEDVARFFSYFVPILLFVIAIGITIFYITTLSKGEFHADCSDTIYWANATWESGSLLYENFSYACLLPFGGNLLMLLFFPFFGMSMTTQILGMMTFFILFTLFFCLMLREMGWRLRSICLAGTALLGLLLSSQKMREMFYGHIIYYSLGLLFLFVGGFLYFRLQNLYARRRELGGNSPLLKKHNTIHIVVCLVIFALFFLLTSTDGISSLSIFTLPFLVGVFVTQITDNSTKIFSRENWRVYINLIIMVILMALGMQLASAWAGDITAGYESAYSNYSDNSTWLEHAQGLPMAWLNLFGIENLPGTGLMSFDSIHNLIHLFTGILIAAFPIIATCFYPKYAKTTSGKQVRMWIWIHWGVTVIILLGYICGNLSAANWRLLPIVGTSFVTMVLFVRWAVLEHKPVMRLPAILAIPIAILCLWNIVDIMRTPVDYQESDLYEISAYLEENGYDYGYATFWRSNAITVISNSESKVRCVTIDGDTGDITPYYYQTQSEWYDEQLDQDQYFLLVDGGEYNTIVSNGNPLTYEMDDFQVIELDNGAVYYLFLYNHNIF